MNGKENLVIIFIKCPLVGTVKTRLSKTIGEKMARELYMRFVLDIIASLEGTNIPFVIYYTIDSCEETMVNWIGKDYRYHVQEGIDLGNRIINSFNNAFSEGYERVILMASDSPDLPPNIIKNSFEFLRLNDAVIGPAEDGGYYLVGFRKETFTHTIFRGIEWSSGTEFRETMNKLKEKGASVHILPEWYDIDRYEDLKNLYENNKNTFFSGSKTMKFIRNNTDLFK
ncbi:MAG: TIGR04282 family arsenosugar biosynthesis glycosyltransferase [Candidatus Thermoplasmatota archaeon]|jgi:hypothetical protein|nr:TIGR04282 family arsenosugar biosynthesis glycosyltransferase [Candidatus Thermoplasmatota archaeon]MDP7264500.1 TIGR04282 family arsenosugar biosynthesis glycosyltransferase [Candidatus Thermoplasmatota archaeon]MDP7421456.1 TIGR04282 family arsenosugar biosynthesis glycosyltransferase [bacterium]